MADETVKKYKERILKEISGDWGSLTPGKTKIKTKNLAHQFNKKTKPGKKSGGGETKQKQKH